MFFLFPRLEHFGYVRVTNRYYYYYYYYCEDQLLCPLLNCLRYLCVRFFVSYKVYS